MRVQFLGDTGVQVSAYSLGSAMFGAWGNSDGASARRSFTAHWTRA